MSSSAQPTPPAPSVTSAAGRPGDMEALRSARDSLARATEGFCGVGITRTSQGGMALALRQQSAAPDGWVQPQRWEGFPVEYAFIGPARELRVLPPID